MLQQGKLWNCTKTRQGKHVKQTR